MTPDPLSSIAIDKAERLVDCPACGTSIVWDVRNPDRPFCSARCKLIDLGAWATEQYSITSSESALIPTSDDQSTTTGPPFPDHA